MNTYDIHMIDIHMIYIYVLHMINIYIYRCNTVYTVYIVSYLEMCCQFDVISYLSLFLYIDLLVVLCVHIHMINPRMLRMIQHQTSVGSLGFLGPLTIDPCRFLNSPSIPRM